ncbi:hypothetical protein BIU98_10175 [Curtobacterium sp. MMLR14_010]|nr:hypothetical protein BIU98_10175 [Curtobacterium sp. MMLR14_010]
MTQEGEQSVSITQSRQMPSNGYVRGSQHGQHDRRQLVQIDESGQLSPLQSACNLIWVDLKRNAIIHRGYEGFTSIKEDGFNRIAQLGQVKFSCAIRTKSVLDYRSELIADFILFQQKLSRLSFHLLSGTIGQVEAIAVPQMLDRALLCESLEGPGN